MHALNSVSDQLLDATRVAADLLRQGWRVEGIRIHARGRPSVRVRPGTARLPLSGSRYAWGRDTAGAFERYAALINGVQVEWELRHRVRPRRLS